MPIPQLMDGWKRFRAGRYQDQQKLFEQVAREGQQPHTLMVSCCDSRVDPAILFDCDPGELFVVRNVANLVPPCASARDHDEPSYHGTSAAIEFAVTVLAVRHVVVLGHSQCGGMRALIEGVPEQFGPMPFLSAWIMLAEEARDRAMAASAADTGSCIEACGQLAIGMSLRNLMTYPVVKERVESGGLTLHGLHYSLLGGELSELDHEQGKFVKIVEGDGG